MAPAARENGCHLKVDGLGLGRAIHFGKDASMQEHQLHIGAWRMAQGFNSLTRFHRLESFFESACTNQTIDSIRDFGR
jgi:hypothetical protein